MAEEKEEDTPLKTMKAIVCTALGEPSSVLKVVEDRTVPTLKESKELRAVIKVLCAAINPIDYKLIKGLMGPFGKKPDHVPGFDICGRIVEIGPNPKKENDKGLKVGDLIYGQSKTYSGSLAQYALVNIKDIEKAPKNVTPLQAAAIPLVSQTSFQSLQTAQLTKGQKLLILGGSTSTGMAAIQIAKNYIECSEVVVTSSQEELCKSLGADRVINYRKEKWEEALKDYACDAIYDCVGGIKSWNDCRSQNVLKKQGHYVTIVGDDTNAMTVGKIVGSVGSMINRSFWAKMGNQKYHVVLTDSSKDLDTITELIENGKLKPMLDEDSPYKFEDYGKMFEKQMAHKARGKLVMTVSEDDVGNDNNDEQKEDAKEYKINKRPKDDVSDAENEEDNADDKEKEKIEKIEEEPVENGAKDNADAAKKEEIEEVTTKEADE